MRHLPLLKGMAVPCLQIRNDQYSLGLILLQYPSRIFLGAGERPWGPSVGNFRPPVFYWPLWRHPLHFFFFLNMLEKGQHESLGSLIMGKQFWEGVRGVSMRKVFLLGCTRNKSAACSTSVLIWEE